MSFEKARPSDSRDLYRQSYRHHARDDLDRLGKIHYGLARTRIHGSVRDRDPPDFRLASQLGGFQEDPKALDFWNHSLTV